MYICILLPSNKSQHALIESLNFFLTKVKLCLRLSLAFTATNKQIKLGWALFVTCTIIQSIMRSEMCSLHLTHPSVHTWSSGQPTVQRPGSSRGHPVGAGIRTHNLGLPWVSSPTLYPLGQRLPQIKLGWALFVTYTILQSIMRSEMCSLHLTHPSVHTWSSGQPTVQRPGSSRGLPAGAKIRTHNLGLPRVSSPTLYPLGQRLPNDFTVGVICWFW